MARTSWFLKNQLLISSNATNSNANRHSSGTRREARRAPQFYVDAVEKLIFEKLEYR
jgi:hypothetical protein